MVDQNNMHEVKYFSSDQVAISYLLRLYNVQLIAPIVCVQCNNLQTSSSGRVIKPATNAVIS